MKSRLLFAIELISRDVIFELLEIVENAEWKKGIGKTSFQ
jgi:hypothetical protein